VSEYRRLRGLENKALWRIFVPKREEGTGIWGKLHDERIYHLWQSLNIMAILSGRMRWDVYKIFVRKFEGEKPIGS
jgi:hypothetical protein